MTSEWTDVLDGFLKDESMRGYLKARPTTRHEAWLLMSALSNIELAKEMRELRSVIEKFAGNGHRKKLEL
jgi:hypothetical protein